MLIPQPDHAALAGALAAQWGNDEFEPPEPRASLLIAASEHDAGWSEWEAAPGLNPQGEPADYIELSVGEHLYIWRQSIRRVTALDRYAGLLVSLHATGLTRGDPGETKDAPEAHRLVEEFLEAQTVVHRSIRRSLRESPAYAEAVQEIPLAHNSRLLQIWDWLSLVLCSGHPQRQVVGAAPGKSAGDRVDLLIFPRGDLVLRLKPYPFRESPLTLTVRGRIVSRGPYPDATAFHRALVEGRLESVTFRIERGGSWSGR